MPTSPISGIDSLRSAAGAIPSTKYSFHAAEIYLVLVLLLFGLSACFLLPVSGGYDEETHLMRVWEMSSLVLIPNEGNMPFPAVYWEMSYRRPFLVRAVEPDFWTKYGNLSLDAHDYIYGTVETRSVYSPPLLLPQALVMRYLGRSWQLPALTVFYACRLVGLFSYMLLVWLAVRLVPFGKWPLAILAASPVAILQASTISADAISNGLAFLFIAGTLFVAGKASQSELNGRDWGLLALLFFILFWGKLNLVPLAVLPFLILRPAQFKNRFGYPLLIVTAIVLCIVEVFGWNALAYSRFSTALEGADPFEQLKFILFNPLKIISILAVDIGTKSINYFRNWIAIYGYAYWPVPTLTYYLYMAGLIAALFVKEEMEISRRIRIGLLIVFAIAYITTILSLYITFNPVGNHVVEGVQGRYFTTVMPLLFLAGAGLPVSRRIHPSAFLAGLLTGLSLVVYVAGMYLSYHVACGAQYYESGLCYQPNYKNWAPNSLYSAPLSNQLNLKQEIVPECNGLTELRVWVNAVGANSDGKTKFALRDVSRQIDVSTAFVPNSELPTGSWYTLNFEPDWESDGKLYLLTIQTDGSGTIGPRIAYSLRQEYPAGKLYENDEPINKDVIFQTGCVAGWEKKRQAGRP